MRFCDFLVYSDDLNAPVCVVYKGCQFSGYHFKKSRKIEGKKVE